MTAREPPADGAPPVLPPRTSIRRRLVLGSTVLIAAAFLVAALSLYFTMYRPLLGELTALEMRRASEKVAGEIETVFVRVEAIAARNRAWGLIGVINLDDLTALNRLVGPLTRSTAAITSVAVAEDSGRELLAFASTQEGWHARLTDPGQWGKRARFMRWDARGDLVSTEEREVEYDARQRPWFAVAMAQSDDSGVAWTAPYQFLSTQELGISAVVSWRAGDGHRYAMTTDIRLFDLTHYTQHIGVGKTGLAAVLTEDGIVLGLPRSGKFETASAIRAALFQPVETLAVAPLSAGFAAWRMAGRPESRILMFAVEGAPWLATFEPIRLGDVTLWTATLAPSADFGTLTGDTLALAIALALGTIAIASLGAFWIARRFSGPIEQLTAESARIGAMDLHNPIAVQSPVLEIDALARSLEKMRLNLARGQAELEAKAGLERQLEQARRSEAIGQLAGGIAHDFNNILGTILGFADFLVQDLPADAPQHGYAERIRLAGSRGRDMVRQILAFSRGTTVERAPHDLVHIVADTRELLRASLPTSTGLAIETGDDALIAEVNVGQMSQVLLNLCLNGNDALAGEPGRLTVALSRVDPGAADYALFGAEGAMPEGRLCAGTLDPSRAYARIAVSDTGVGIAPEALKRIFDPFFTTKERGRGTGLGLAVVHGIVLAYHGAYTVASRPGAGTTVSVYLPLLDRGEMPAASVAPPEEIRGRERILVIDDEIDLADMLAIGLDRLGYEVVALNDPVEALAIYTGGPDAWDVVISDEVMPGMKGLALFARLKAVNAGLRFILCTGYSDGTTEETALAAGIDAFFLKPVSPEQLAACIRRLTKA